MLTVKFLTKFGGCPRTVAPALDAAFHADSSSGACSSTYISLRNLAKATAEAMRKHLETIDPLVHREMNDLSLVHRAQKQSSVADRQEIANDR